MSNKLRNEYCIEKMNNLSGNKCNVYSIRIKDEPLTLIEDFITENSSDFTEAINEIVLTIKVMADKTGAEEYFF